MDKISRSYDNIRTVLERDKDLLYNFVKGMNTKGLFGKYAIKGNILLHYIQLEYLNNNFSDFIRLTQDIDMSMLSFKDVLTQEKVINVLKELQLGTDKIIEVDIMKEPSEKRTSWNLRCYKSFGNGNKLQRVLSLDIDSKGFKDEFVKIYSVDDQDFYGSTIEKIAADKIRSISTNSVKNRVKDIFDIDLLLRIGFDSVRVMDILLNDQSVSDFSFLFNNIKYLKEKLSRLPISIEDIQYDTKKALLNTLNIALIVRKAKSGAGNYETKLAMLIKPNGYKLLGFKSRDGVLFKTISGQIVKIGGNSDVRYI